mmetsp:Transcript_26978/g.41830  ORF Transcript_26978/g.41830 Transcript_26978/m.41830 type:complete len:291 (+) Transcript_26978:3-875(+)
MTNAHTNTQDYALGHDHHIICRCCSHQGRPPPINQNTTMFRTKQFNLIKNLSRNPKPTDVGIEDIRRCMERKKWRSLRTMLTKEGLSAEEAILADPNSQLLLLACKYGAPVDVIERLVTIKPDLAWETDDDCNRAPLHIACLNAYSNQDAPDILTVLIAQNPKATTCLDSNGNTPLHLLCKNYCNCIRAVVAIDVLSRKGPAALIIENNEGQTPLEILLLSEETGIFGDNNLQIDAIKKMHAICSQYSRKADQHAKRRKRKSPQAIIRPVIQRQHSPERRYSGSDFSART